MEEVDASSALSSHNIGEGMTWFRMLASEGRLIRVGVLVTMSRCSEVGGWRRLDSKNKSSTLGNRLSSPSFLPFLSHTTHTPSCRSLYTSTEHTIACRSIPYHIPNLTSKNCLRQS